MFDAPPVEVVSDLGVDLNMFKFWSSPGGAR